MNTKDSKKKASCCLDRVFVFEIWDPSDYLGGGGVCVRV